LAHRVFLSHAREDHTAASGICALLEAEGIGCWLAARDLQEDSDPAAATLEAIRSSDLVLLIFSAAANASRSVLRDIERAVAYERPVLSIHLDKAAPNPSLEYYLNLWQWLEASEGIETQREVILTAVREQLRENEASGTWRWLDAPEGVESRRQDIISAVRGRFAQEPGAESQQPDATPPSQRAGTSGLALRRRLGRRAWALGAGAALVALALGLGLGLGLTAQGRDDGTWAKLAPQNTAPSSSGALIYDPVARRFIMFGRPQPLDPFNLRTPPIADTWAYDPAANTWTELEPSGTLPKTGGILAYDSDTRRIIMFGGSGSGNEKDPLGGWFSHDTAQTWAYDPAANSWEELKPAGAVPAPRGGGSMAYDPNTRRLILFGGFANAIATYHSESSAYDPTTKAWRVTPSRANTTMAEDPATGRFLVYGARADTATTAGLLNDTWAYDPETNAWSNLQPQGALPSARVGNALVYDLITRHLILFGGVGVEDVCHDTWAYDPVANKWTNLRPSGETPTGYATSLTYDLSTHRVILFGGSSPDGSKYFDTTWAYDPVANQWAQLEPAGTRPGARCAPAFAVDESTGRLIMFGGVAPGVKTSLNDMWVFTP
jgi:N-acetylneuraminic acid mutarotase